MDKKDNLKIVHKNENDDENKNVLDDLFGTIERLNNTPVQSSNKGLGAIDITDYEEIEIDESTHDKVSELKEIAKRYELSNAVLEIPEEYKPDQLKINYLQELNKRQCIAAVSTKGACLVIAGAGSGKTRIIVYRVSYLLEQGVNPQEILLLTFTRKAAREMLDRVEKLLQNNAADKIPGGTFHAFANYTLRKYANLLGISSNFTIIDSEDSADAIDLIKTELGFHKSIKKFPKKNRLQEIYSSARNRMISIREVIENDFTGLIDYIKEIELVYEGFKRYKAISNIFDYDDLMDVFHHHLKTNSHFRKRLQDSYKYVLVDEFQDTNIVQKEIVDFIAGGYKNIMVVGDDTQSIYAFRGANFENILRFPQTYPDCKIIKIEQNYRSNQGILNFTNSIIETAKIGYQKKLYSENKSEWKPIVKKFYSQIEEAEFIVDRILELREKGIELNQMAVLSRAMWHGNFVQTELLRRGIPYIVVGGIKFTERRHIKDLIAFLRILVNPSDAVAWHRILKLLPGIGRVTASNIIKAIRIDNGVISFEDFSKRVFFAELKKLANVLNAANNEEKSVSTKIEYIKEYYAPILESKEYDFNIRLNDIKVFIELAEKYNEISKFLSDFALDPPSNKFQDKGTPLIDEGEDKPLVLSTVHSAKGLEWYAVFIPFALDGLFPSVRALKKFEELEEERRLFYVACSRAKEQLYITMPSYVSSYNAFFSYPSRFLAEIDKGLYVV